MAYDNNLGQDNLFWLSLFMLWCFCFVLDAAPKLMLMAQP